MLVKHSLIYSASTLLNGLFGFAAVAINTRILGVEEYGHLALAVNTALCISTILFEWLRISALRFSETKGGPVLIANTLFLYILGALLAAFLSISVFTSGYNAYFPVEGWLGIGLLAICTGITDLFLGLARSSLRPALFASMQVTRGLASVIFATIAGVLGYGFLGITIAMSIANICTVLFGFISFREWLKLRPSKPTREHLVQILNYGLPIVCTFIAMQVLFVLDRYMISHFHGAHEVGVYAAAGDITQRLIVMIATGINLASYSLVVKGYEENGLSDAVDKMSRTLTVLLGIVLPTSVGIALVSKPLGHFLLGTQVAEQAIPLIPLLAIAAFVQVIRTFYFDQPFHILKMTKKIFLPYVTASVVAGIAWLFLIPSYGAFGALYGLIAAHCSAALVAFLCMRTHFYFKVNWKDVGAVIAAVVGMAIVVGIPDWSADLAWFAVRILSGVGIYIALLVALNVLDIRKTVVAKAKALLVRN